MRIDVADTGVGIARENQTIIFEEFRRLDHSARSRGMGLGLAIVQRASRMLGHPLSLESEPGKGARFGVDVPIGTSRALARAVTPSPRRGQLAGKLVMIIDNEATILSGMRAVLQGWGCTVMTSESEREALTQIDACGDVPDAVLADYHLNGIWTGDVAINAIREHTGVSMAGIVITADRTPELRERLTKEGFPVLNKPVKLAQLRALLTSKQPA